MEGKANADYYWFDKTREQFDTSRNFRVTKNEFLYGMVEFVCCGSRAPFSCNCDPEAFVVFPPVDTATTDRFQLSFDNFMESLLANNLTYLVGKAGLGGCYDQVSATVVGSTGSNEVKLFSEGGEIGLTLRQAASSVDAVHHNETVFTSPRQSHGAILRRADAERLSSTYGKAVGDLASTEEIFLIIDANAMHGNTRWVYTTNPTYLVLDPAFLIAMGGYLLAPSISLERVAFLNNDCNLGLSDPVVAEAVVNATLKRMYEQLSNALMPSTSSTGGLRGHLVLQAYDVDPNPLRTFTKADPRYYSFERTPSGDGADTFTMTIWKNEWLRTTLLASIILAVTAAIGSSVVTMLFCIRFLRKALKVSSRATPLTFARSWRPCPSGV